MAGDWSRVEHGLVLREFLLPIWLTPFALLLVGAYAVWAAYELAFIRMRFAGRDGRSGGSDSRWC